jgi:hypothetical protein
MDDPSSSFDTQMALKAALAILAMRRAAYLIDGMSPAILALAAATMLGDEVGNHCPHEIRNVTLQRLIGIIRDAADVPQQGEQA